MIKVGDVLTIRIYPFNDNINQNKYRDKYYSDCLYRICEFELNDNEIYYNIIEIESGSSPWFPFETLDELELKINSIVEVIKIESI